MKKFILPLLLAASTAHAAPLDRVVCLPGFVPWNKAEIDKARREFDTAQRARDDAQAHPDQPLVLANAFADLAGAVATMTGGPARAASNSGSAVQLIRQASDIWSQAAPDPELAAQLQERGRQFALKGRCALAQPVLQISLDMAEKTKGRDDLQTLEAVNDVLRVALAQGDSAAVNVLAPRLVEGLGKDPKTGINLIPLFEDLGDLYYRSEDYAKAEPMARRSVELAKARLPQDAELTRRLTYKLASILYGQLRYADAEAMIAPLTPAGSAAEPEAGRRRTKEKMAEMVRAGDLAGALAIGERALAQYEPEAVRSRAAFEEAEATYNSAPKSGPIRDKAIAELRKTYPRANSDNLATASMQNYLGEIHHAMNQLTKAEARYLQAQARFPGVDSSPDAIRNATDLAVLYRMRGESERALPLQEAALKAMLPLLGSEHPDVLESQDELALIYRALKRYKEAEPLYVARLQRAERRGAGTQELVDELDALSEIAVAQGDITNGAVYALRTVALWEQAGPARSAQWRAAAARLARLYRESGRADLASALEQRLAPPGKKKKG